MAATNHASKLAVVRDAQQAPKPAEWHAYHAASAAVKAAKQTLRRAQGAAKKKPTAVRGARMPANGRVTVTDIFVCVVGKRNLFINC